MAPPRATGPARASCTRRRRTSSSHRTTRWRSTRWRRRSWASTRWRSTTSASGTRRPGRRRPARDRDRRRPSTLRAENWNFKVGGTCTASWAGWRVRADEGVAEGDHAHEPSSRQPIMFSEVFHDYYHWPLKEKKIFRALARRVAVGDTLFAKYEAEGASHRRRRSGRRKTRRNTGDGPGRGARVRAPLLLLAEMRRAVNEADRSVSCLLRRLERRLFEKTSPLRCLGAAGASGSSLPEGVHVA